MKTVSGSIVSSKPISVKKASSVLNSFISAETGASQAVSAYLRRTSEAFNELVQLHRELKVGRSERKRKKSRSKTIDYENLMESATKPIQNGLDVDQILDSVKKQSLRFSEGFEDGGIDEEERGSERKNKKKKIRNSDGFEIEEEKREERKKRKKVEVEDGGMGDLEERHERKKKKRRPEEES